MTVTMGTVGPEWVWVTEVASLIDRHLASTGMTLTEYARQTHERFGIGPDSVERRVRSARRSGGVMNVHTADRYLVAIDLHLMDLPSYRDAINGDLPPEMWPRRAAERVRGGHGPAAVSAPSS